MKRSTIIALTASLAVAGLSGTAAADSTAQDVAYGAGSVLGTAVLCAVQGELLHPGSHHKRLRLPLRRGGDSEPGRHGGLCRNLGDHAQCPQWSGPGEVRRWPVIGGAIRIIEITRRPVISGGTREAIAREVS